MEIRQTILQQISDGTLPEGKKLPSEKQLAQRFEVSRMTIRQALESLKEERYITTRKGYGSVIRILPKQVPTDLTQLQSIETMIRSSGKKLKELARTVEIGNLNSKESKMLFCEQGTPFTKLIRLRAIDDTPVAVTINIFSESKTPAQIKTFTGSLLSFLEAAGKSVNYAESSIMVPRIGDPYVKLLDGNNTKLPIVILRQLHFNWEHHPIFLSYDYLNLNVFSLNITRKKSVRSVL